MKKKILGLGLSLVLFGSMCGCGQDITLNSEENDLIAEYVAGVMLKYSYENKWSYEQLKKRPWQIKGEESATSGQSSMVGNTISSSGSSRADSVGAVLKQAFDLDGININYKSFVVADNYPEGDYHLGVKADEGCKVFALKFDLKNVAADSIKLDTVATSAVMKLSIGGSVITQSATMLDNDLMGLEGVTVKAGDTYSAVAVFQVPESVAFNTSDMKVSVYVNGKQVGQVLGL